MRIYQDINHDLVYHLNITHYLVFTWSVSEKIVFWKIIGATNVALVASITTAL